MSADDLDPTELAPTQPIARPPDHRRLGDGATRDPEALAALRRASAARRADQGRTALRVGGPRGYSKAERERAQVLRDEAASLRRIAALKTEGHQRRFVEREAEGLERLAEEIVPLEHVR